MKGYTNATNVSEIKPSDGSVTRASLAADAKYAPVTNMTDDRAITLADIGATLYTNDEVELNLLIPANDILNMPIGAEIDLIRYGTGDFTIKTADNVTLYAPKLGVLTYVKILNQYDRVTLKQVDTDVWVIYGNVVDATVAFATITVSFPVGSTCTCYNEATDTLIYADDVSGEATFSPSFAGTWTIKSTDGTFTASQDVKVEAGGEYTVALSYNSLMFDNGTNNVNFSSVSNGAIRGSGPSYYNYDPITITHTIAVDFTLYSTLYITATTAKYVTVQVLDSNKSQISSTSIEAGTTSIDISSVTDECYVQFTITTGYTADIGSLVATKVWLE